MKECPNRGRGVLVRNSRVEVDLPSLIVEPAFIHSTLYTNALPSARKDS